MSGEKQKQRKKKERERRVRKKVLATREYEYRCRKKEKQEEQEELTLLAEYEGKKTPIMSPEKMEAMIKAKLQRNIEVLKALEEQYLAERASQRQVSDELESEGHLTAKDKIDALCAKARVAIENKPNSDALECALEKLEAGVAADWVAEIAVVSPNQEKS